jgi:ubiquinone/menaquinone biosynthesis C-methylase UbiE
MHPSALTAGTLFARTYLEPQMRVIDLGGRNVNGSLRPAIEAMGIHFISVDMEPDASVDVVVPPGQRLPFGDSSIDAVVTTSCFEHDPCFWMTIREMARVTKSGGYLYANAPSSGNYHGHPGDNWRFYKDAGQALAFWCAQAINGSRYGLSVLETFHIDSPPWNDFCCVWQRSDAIPAVTQTVVDPNRPPGHLQRALEQIGVRCLT